jgi:transposase
MSTKIHQLVDGQGRPLVIALTPGQAGDSPMLNPLLSHLAVKRLGPGRPRTRPDAVIGDKAYSSRAIRTELRSRRVKAVIPQPSDQIAHRKRRGSSGGRPPTLGLLHARPWRDCPRCSGSTICAITWHPCSSSQGVT